MLKLDATFGGAAGDGYVAGSAPDAEPRLPGRVVIPIVAGSAIVLWALIAAAGLALSAVLR